MNTRIATVWDSWEYKRRHADRRLSLHRIIGLILFVVVAFVLVAF